MYKDCPSQTETTCHMDTKHTIWILQKLVCSLVEYKTVERRTRFLQRLRDTANNVQAYTSTPTEYKFDVDTEPWGGWSLCAVQGRLWACRKIERRTRFLQRLRDTANNVQAYTSTPTEYKFDVDTEPWGGWSLYAVQGRVWACRKKLYALTEMKTSSINWITRVQLKTI